jgi:hypothetical protein
LVVIEQYGAIWPTAVLLNGIAEVAVGWGNSARDTVLMYSRSGIRQVPADHPALPITDAVAHADAVRDALRISVDQHSADRREWNSERTSTVQRRTADVDAQAEVLAYELSELRRVHDELKARHRREMDAYVKRVHSQRDRLRQMLVAGHNCGEVRSEAFHRLLAELNLPSQPKKRSSKRRRRPATSAGNVVAIHASPRYGTSGGA